MKPVRIIQIVLFIIGLAAYVAAAALWESMLGLTFWRVGTAAMLTAVVCIMLWPKRRDAMRDETPGD